MKHALIVAFALAVTTTAFAKDSSENKPACPLANHTGTAFSKKGALTRAGVKAAKSTGSTATVK